MKKKTLYYVILTTLLVVGFGLLMWGAIKIDNYPHLKELRKEAFQTVKTQYIIGLILMCIGWIFSGMKKFFQ